MEKALTEARSELARQAGTALLDQARIIGTARLVLGQIEAESSALRDIAADLIAQGDNIIVLLAAVNDGKIAIIAGVSKALTKTIKAGELVNYVAGQVGGKGGGRPELAQAGGQDIAALELALASVTDWLASKLG